MFIDRLEELMGPRFGYQIERAIVYMLLHCKNCRRYDTRKKIDAKFAYVWKCATI
jgi:hypothetical protein